VDRILFHNKFWCIFDSRKYGECSAAFVYAIYLYIETVPIYIISMRHHKFRTNFNVHAEHYRYIYKILYTTDYNIDIKWCNVTDM